MPTGPNGQKRPVGGYGGSDRSGHTAKDIRDCLRFPATTALCGSDASSVQCSGDCSQRLSAKDLSLTNRRHDNRGEGISTGLVTSVGKCASLSQAGIPQNNAVGPWRP
jgi:hypothetical protein